MGAPLQESSVQMAAAAASSHNKHEDEKTAAAASSLASLEATYTSLIQQHLSVLCVENATFLAERLVASVPNSSNAVYLLAMCYYRGGAPRRARAVLEEFKEKYTPSMAYLLAKCLHDLQQYNQAEQVLLEECRTQSRPNQPSLLVHPDDSSAQQTMDEWILSTTPCPIPNGAAGLYLLGNICRKSHRKLRATQYYKMSLALDPTLWTSYSALCEMGDESIDPASVFGVEPQAIQMQEETEPPQQASSPPFSVSHTPTMMEATALQPMELGTPSTGGSSYMHKTALFQTGRKSTATSTKRPILRHPHTATQPSSSLFETPNLTPIPRTADDDGKTTSGSSRQVSRARHVAARLYYEPSPETTPPPMSFYHDHTRNNKSSFLSGLDHDGPNTTTNTNNNYNMNKTMQGRLSFSGVADSPAVTSRVDSSRRKPRNLFASTNKKNTNNNHSSTFMGHHQEEEEAHGSETARATAAETKSATATAREAMHQDAVQMEEDESSGVQEILELLCVLGTAYKQQCQYRCREALQTFHALPPEQFHTGWVLHQVGRAYFEIADYQSAKKSLELMQQIEPHRMAGLEVLSTTLWHLKQEVELSHLAQRAVDFDRLSPEAWCVVGNCFSLQKEHETALTFFKRSIQLDPSFTYSHTLSGHEFVANEDFEKAVACYRDAIRVDERHYNAWYGLGAIYYRQEKYDLAEYHFKRAISINPQSAVLLCHLGMAQHAGGKAYEALDTLAEAFRLDPRNAQARYQRATIYMALERPHEALAELKKVRDAAPRESSVHFAMGRVLKKIGRPEQAMRCFLTALDLDPKDNNLIKAAMDKLDEPDVDEEVSAF